MGQHDIFPPIVSASSQGSNESAHLRSHIKEPTLIVCTFYHITSHLGVI